MAVAKNATRPQGRGEATFGATAAAGGGAGFVIGAGVVACAAAVAEAPMVAGRITGSVARV